MINCPLLETLTTIADKRANKTKRTTTLYSTIKTDSTSTCRTQETPQDCQASRVQRTCYCCYGQGLDYTDKMCSLVNDKKTYESRKRDATPALQLRLNSKLLDLKKTKTIDIQLYYRVRYRVPQSAKLYGLPRLHKPNIPMRSPLSHSVGLLLTNFPNT